MIIGTAFREIWHATSVIVIFHFGIFQQKKDISKKKKKKREKKKTPGDIIMI